MNHQSKSNSTGPSNGAVSQAHEILRQTITNAQAMFATLDINRSTSVLAGYRGLDIKVLTALPNESASVGDPAVALAIRKLLSKKHCDGVVITYPVNLDPIAGGDDSPPHPESGLLIDVQVVDKPSLKWVIPIVARVDGENIFGLPVPLTKGVLEMEIYSDLLSPPNPQ